MYDSILVATDGSEAADAAVSHAISLAASLDADVTAVAVLETRTGYDNAIVDPETVDEQRRERARSWLEDAEGLASEAGVALETRIMSGVPHEEILALAADRDVDVVVVGSQGRSSFKGALLGSTVDRVVRLADRPVTVVDAATEQDD
ncbi:universal stress protein [Natrarchaeobaculum aegyptiacum]|uniref:Universal stress protein UspA n=1 Tax=Natrarchaeobaculum aegyptiacum TaxID=745377 RepID=A0A2Z2HXK7_9EURY|nr:universal stress protein [Natrarchaeobaculum aegyptiacum]ARS90407.1 universal stress protein UspA [Natrarchaeobaculum aegyptiacum]